MSRTGFLRGRMALRLLDSYTRDQQTTVRDDPATLTVDESTGPWGEAVTQEGGVTVAGVPETTLGVPCMWIDAGSLWRSGEGTLILDTPLLLVANEDTIGPGDEVSNVVDKDGVMRFAGPGVVESTQDFGPPGYSSLRTVLIRYVKSV